MNGLRLKYFLRLLLLLLFGAHLCVGQQWKSSYAKAHDTWGKSWDQTISSLKEAELVARRDLGIFNQDYLVILNDLGLALYEAGNYNEAATVLQRSLDYRKEILEENDMEYAVARLNLARVYSGNASPQAITIYRELAASGHPDVRIKAVKGLYDVYMSEGRISDARSFLDSLLSGTGEQPDEFEYIVRLMDIDQLRQTGKFMRAKSALEDFSARVNFSDASVLNRSLEAIYYEQRGLLLMEEREFAESEKCLLRVIEIKRQLGFDEGELVTSRNNLATLYEKFGLYDKALNEIDQALSNCFHDCEKLLQNKAAILLVTGNSLESEVILNELYGNYTFRSPDEELIFLLTYANTFVRDNWKDRNPALVRASDVVARHGDQISARSLGYYYEALGVWNVRNGNLTDAVSALESAQQYFAEVYGDESLALRDVESNLGICYILDGRLAEGTSMLLSANEREKKIIRFVFPMLSRTEQALFMEQMRNDLNTLYSAIMDQAATDNDLAGLVYEKQLLYKGLSLQTNRMDAGAELSGVPHEVVDEFTALRNKLTAIFTEGRAYSEGFESSDLNRLQELESLIARQTGNRFVNGDLPYDSLAAMIGSKEILVEIIRYKNYNFRNVYNADSVSYAAMVIRAEDNIRPRIVHFPSGSFMEHRQLKYFLNAINYGISDTLSYESLWKPLEPYMAGKETCYFISDGLYYKVNPSALRIPGQEQFLIDRIEIRQLNNLYEYEASSRASKDYRKPQHALLIGDPALGAKGGASRFTRLEGAGEEIGQLSGRLKTAGWEIDQLTGEMASKENLEGARKEGVLHFATHGYFSEREVARDMDLPDLDLFRSGLVLTKPGSTQGDLLTAFEVAAMDLSGSDLVVLSACETGLGEVRNGDGVFGLQYAFFAAGTRSMLISLWQVNDRITSEYMKVFYDELLATGNKRIAYRNVQKKMKAKYPNPKYWAAFIYLGE